VSGFLDALIWSEHEAWLRDRPRRWIERERWTDADWLAVRRAADEGWDANSYYVYAAEKAVRDRQHERIAAYLAHEASHGTEWLLGVLARTHIEERRRR
jgi:hypothetical protein